ncbi:hypothetical protein P171DRAFT_476517 [Karstenula rhodostoma CBS 690.94]|uniref:Cytidyltransferase-like domain-containing protein n=1 Tax=Karstenula rhodostoma CBS 690.94 TaxID=1392251 RepID=A0A9P4U7U2_9PLEO|nr:hypothetical protein P171DRAFT_476517 [Karstenula rhodostoma CBS 690.94]
MSLKNYLQMAYKEIGLSSEAEVRSIEPLTGTLQSGSENLLLVYGGSFNPPHRGHIDVILSGLRPEVAAVALVILPSEDWHLKDKISNSHPDFFLPQKRRAELLGSIQSIPRARVWVWTATWYPFKPFCKALFRLTKADGFKLAFARLVGPDNLDTKAPLNIMPYAFPGVLVTNRARYIASHFLSDGKPVRWNGFGDWSRSTHSFGDDGGQAGEAEIVLWTCTGVCDHNPPQVVCQDDEGETSQAEVVLGTCGVAFDSNPARKGYYLQYSKHVSTDISSTNLRLDLVQNHLPSEARLNQLSNDALLELLGPILGGE